MGEARALRAGPSGGQRRRSSLAFTAGAARRTSRAGVGRRSPLAIRSATIPDGQPARGQLPDGDACVSPRLRLRRRLRRRKSLRLGSGSPLDRSRAGPGLRRGRRGAPGVGLRRRRRRAVVEVDAEDGVERVAIGRPAFRGGERDRVADRGPRHELGGIDRAEAKEEGRLGVEAGSDPVHDGGDVLAHGRPVRTRAPDLDLGRCRGRGRPRRPHLYHEARRHSAVRPKRSWKNGRSSSLQKT